MAHGPLPTVRPGQQLVGALGGLGALAVSAVGRESPAAAANGDAVVQGQTNTATATTVQNTSASQSALWGNATATTGTGVGVRGDSAGDAGSAVWGNATAGASGVYGQAVGGIGVVAYTKTGRGLYAVSDDNIAVDATSYGANYAVRAAAFNATAATFVTGSDFGAGVEVQVQNAGNGRGAIEANHTGNGPAVQATAAKGFTIHGSARLRFEKVSGVATVPAGSTGVTISPGVNVTGGSFVLLTPRANIGSRGLWYVPNATANTFRIRMSASRSSNTKIAWLLLG